VAIGALKRLNARANRREGGPTGGRRYVLALDLFCTYLTYIIVRTSYPSLELILGRYEEALWSNAAKVLVSFQTRQLWYAYAKSSLADLKLELDSGFSELEGAVRVVCRESSR
jgi:hypothetical protein